MRRLGGLFASAGGWRASLSSPLAAPLACSAVLFLVGLGWGLPASDTWDNDGVAPRDFLVAVAQTFDRGPFDVAYLHLAPVHLLLLALWTLPVAITAIVRAPGFAPDAVVHEIIQVPYMTLIALLARALTAAMALGHVWALARIGQEIRGRRAAFFVALVSGMNAVVVYYAHTTDLEVPYLFWASLALLALVRAIVRRQPRRLRTFALLGALAIGTKDQAAGVFLLGAPAAVGLWLMLDGWAAANRARVLREAGIALGLALGAFLLVDEIVINPAGFLARLDYLLGSASVDHAEYSRDWAGRSAALVDLVRRFPWFFPVGFAPFSALGIAGVLAGARDKRAGGTVPLLAAASFVVTIVLTTLRTEQRFVLFPMEMMGLYAGLGFDGILSAARGGPARRVAGAAVALLCGWALYDAANVDAVLLFDPRYDAEGWLASHLKKGDLVETYGINAYLPRFPRDARVVRVAPSYTRPKNPLAGVIDVQDAWDALPKRSPKWIVISDAWVWHYLEDPPAPKSGRILPSAQVDQAHDTEASHYFRALLGGELGYKEVHISRFTSWIWHNVRIHSSTGETIWILERED
jgi:hypothetical protein